MKKMIEHVALRVTDLDRSIEFYRGVMGLQPVSRRMIGDGAIEQVVFRVGEDVLVLFHSKEGVAVDPDPEGVMVSENLQKKAKQKWTGRMDHMAFCLDEDEYNAVLKRLGEHGYKVHRGPERNLGAFGVGYATYFYDPDHIEVEIKRYDDPPEIPGDEWYETGEKYPS
jgi:catechol 2,3-dioxygenase-like lactoylglutathione lyase family enzyme